MKEKWYSVEQIVATLKQHQSGISVADISRKLGIAEQTFYRWKSRYGGLEPDRQESHKVLAAGDKKISLADKIDDASINAMPKMVSLSHRSTNALRTSVEAAAGDV